MIGVVRDVRSVPQNYTTFADAPVFVDAAADQYRAAILEAPGTSPVEYLVWAANSSQLALVNNSAWWSEEGSGTIPPGDLQVVDATPEVIPAGDVFPANWGYFLDGADRAVVVDSGNRSISNIQALVVARGDVDDYDDDGWVDPDNISMGRSGTNPYLVLSILTANQIAESGFVTLTAAQLVQLAGGLSLERGDQIMVVRYTVATGLFWWTRNDRYETRFGWNSTTRRWEPYQGSKPQSLGALLFDTVYQISPKLKNLPVNSYLPGDSSIPDGYSMIRLGADPSHHSTPVDKVRVVVDSDVESVFDFSRDPLSNAVIGQTNGKLQFNPSYVQQNAGKGIWYVFKGFSPTSDGVVGKLLDARDQPLFIAPIPSPTDRPFIRIGNRKPLFPILLETDSLLESSPLPIEGVVYISLSTGRVLLSPVDTAKADPTSSGFSKYYLGEDVIYAGVALNGAPQACRASIQLLDQTGAPGTAQSQELYVPDYAALPGLGVSGILDTPDGTGALPTNPGVAAALRPGGANTGDPNIGRIRQIDDGISDTFLFSRSGAVPIIQTVTSESDLPESDYLIPQGIAYIAKERSNFGSRVVLSKADKELFGDLGVYFLQSGFNPAYYTILGRLYSNVRDIFRFTGDETLYFAIDGISYTWTPTALMGANPTATYFTPTQVADSIDAVITGTGYARESNGHVMLQGGQVEIGWGVGGIKDLSGAAALGFIPGWLAISGADNWNQDSGVTLGLYRSPVNLDRASGIADFQCQERLTDFLLVDGVRGLPFVFLNQPPLQDIPGIDDGVFFNLTTTITQGETTTIVNKPLEHYVDIIHRFGQNKFDWVERDLQETELLTATATLPLGHLGIVPESMLGAPDIGGGLYISEDGGANSFQTQDIDYILPQDGISGNAVLIERFGAKLFSGANGVTTAGSGTFTDTDIDFSSVTAGCRLKLTSGDETGSYIVQSAAGSTVVVSPSFIYTSTQKITWELYAGYPDSVYDPALVADQNYKEFNHLQTEPFVVKVLSYAGTVGGSTALKASVEGAVKSGRVLALRFGLAHANSGNVAILATLTQTTLGTLANNVLVVPNTGSLRFSTGSFSIKIGTTKFMPVGVASFSANPVGVEYLTVDGAYAKGTLRFNSSLISTYVSATVSYVEEFFSAALLSLGQAELDPNTGEINLSQDDLTNHSGAKCYFVEQLITEERKDVSISPLSGSFSPNNPLPAGSVVEVSYWAANLEGRKIGDQITEFLPVFVRDELSIRQKQNTYLFNSAFLYTVDQTIEPIVYIGPTMQNFGSLDYVVDYPSDLNGQGRITFISKVVADYLPVTVTYAVYETTGGERSFETSQKPVYRPPFYITANQSRFGLRGDRVFEFQLGQLLRLGSECFYVKSLKYYSAEDVTSVGVFPPTVTEVGSRAPGNDVISFISANPITTVVDPDGYPVVTTAPTGFMSVIDTSIFPFDPVTKGQKTIVFRGNLTQFAIPGHILEVGGCPFTIATAELNEDGSRTKITLTSGFQSEYRVPSTVKLSYRPIYPPNSREFLGGGSVLDTEPFELVLYPTFGPGRTLVANVEYSLDASNGQVKLLSPVQEVLGAGEKLALASFTKLKMLQPFLQDGIIATPRVAADYLYNTIPSEQNGLLDSQVTATYTFANPDTFYFRALTLRSYLGEAAQEAVAEIQAKQPVGGPINVSAEGLDNWDQGRVGLKGERKNLLDKDRAARVFLGFYNDTVIGFEQVLETITGKFIGDRDGKFRFWRGFGKDYPTPGFEDDISGLLTARNVWSDVLNDQNPSLAIYAQLGDWIVTPETALVVDSVVSGELPNSSILEKLSKIQGALIKNDVDDIVLVRLGKPTTETLSYYPWFKFRAQGTYRKMGEQHKLSRLFPTVTKAFFRVGPGAGSDEDSGDAGVYTAGRVIDGEMQRTSGTQIGQIANPALGDITQIGSVELQKRLARGRVWGYYPNGIPAGVFSSGLSPAITDPCLIVFPVELSRVTVNPATGFPDDAQLLSQGGSLPDATTGDPEMSVPGFLQYDQICWGQPDGKVYPSYDGGSPVTVAGIPTYLSIFVNQVLYGCVVTFYSAPVPVVWPAPPAPWIALTDPDNVLVGTATGVGVRADYFPIIQGDTLFAVPKTGDRNPASLPDPPEYESIEDAANSNGSFRIGFDVKVTSEGEVIDATLPSFADPSPLGLKETLGQSPPLPLSTLEGEVCFSYPYQNPFGNPALLGLPQDDSGDYQIPYLRTGNTEKERFDQASVGLIEIMTTLDSIGGYQYPDEFVGTDGDISITEGFFPATLTSSIDVRPVSHGSTDVGIGDLSRYDLLLVKTETGNGSFTTGLGPIQGPQGIQSVGTYYSGIGNSSRIETPRFVTATKAPGAASTITGDTLRYSFINAMSYVQGAYEAQPQLNPGNQHGIYITENLAAGLTILDFDDVVGNTAVILNDGQTIATGNFNDIINGLLPNNHLIIKIIARRDTDITTGPAGPNPLPSSGAGGQIALTMDIQANQVSLLDYQGNFYGPFALVVDPTFGTHFPVLAPVINNRQIYINATGIIPFLAAPGTENHWFLPYAVIDSGLPTQIQYTLYGLEWAFDVRADLMGGQSSTGWIDQDRLTFNDLYDLSWAKKRGYVHPQSGISLESRLQITETIVGHHPAGMSTTSRSTINNLCNGTRTLGPVAIIGVSVIFGDFTVAGDWTDSFIVGDTITVANSTGNDGSYTVNACRRSGFDTEVYVNEPVLSGVADGDISWTTADPFTFVPRLDDHTIGDWSVRTGLQTERGSVRVMGFEGFNNTPIETTADVTFSAIPSTAYDETGLICVGDGLTSSQFNSDLPPEQIGKWDNRVANLILGVGDEDRVVPGDLLVIKTSTDSNHPATVHAGTYVVRHSVKPSPGLQYKLVAPSTTAGTEEGWCPVHFPKVVSFDSATNELIITDLAPARGGVLVGGTLCGFTTLYASNPRIYIIRNVSGLASIHETVWRYSVLSAAYTLIQCPGPGPEGYFTLTDYRDAFGTALTASQFSSYVSSGGYEVSGMRYLPVKVSGSEYGLPANNCVGYDSDSEGIPPFPNYAQYGFRWVQFESPTGGTSAVFDGDFPVGAGYYPLRKVGVLQDTLTLVVDAVLESSNQFVTETDTPIYPWIVHTLNLNTLSVAPSTLWASVNIPAAAWGFGSNQVKCLLPGTVLRLENPLAAPLDTEGFQAQAGIFLEPSVPRSSLNLDVGYQRLVDATHNLPDPGLAAHDRDREIGMRDVREYDIQGTTFAEPDAVSFEIRRIRRWHNTNTTAQEIRPLQFAYEIRRGRITSYLADTQQRGVVTASGFTMNWESTKPPTAPWSPDVWNDGGVYTGTNLGIFTDSEVNIHTGDSFRLLDANGDLLEEVEIQSVLGPDQIRLAPPGLQTSSLTGMRFEIYLKQAPVPHEQSYGQLLYLMSDLEVTRTVPDWATGKGGYTPEVGIAPVGPSYSACVNNLYDDLNAAGGTATFAALGVRKGDILIVDPSPTIPQVGGLPATSEKGFYPIGDIGVAPRGAPIYAAGKPSLLDDNRGFYRVTQVVSSPTPHLLVQPVNTFAGSYDAPVIFDSSDVTRAYAVYPTVSDSALKQAPFIDPGNHDEGQMDLRPTKIRDAGTKSFKTGNLGHSMRPFGYSIIRPSPLFSDEAIDLILMGRERVLSLIQMLRGLLSKDSTYFIFQRDEHCADLGDPLDPGVGLGVMSNPYLGFVLGKVDTVPFANNGGCLSFLDRRFWIFDERLDNLTWDGAAGMKLLGPGETPYTAYSDTTGGGSGVRPMLTERIDEVLNCTDRFRPIRYIWLAYRTHKILGTLASIARYDLELPERLVEQKANLLLQKSLENVE
jgi:hypothetical protein